MLNLEAVFCLNVLQNIILYNTLILLGITTFRYRRYKFLIYQGFQPIGQQIANNIS